MWIFAIVLLFFVVGVHSTNNATDCLAKERSKGALDLAKESIEKAKYLYPNCSDSTNSSGCGAKEKSIAFLDIANVLIKEAENNYPTCPDHEPQPKPEPEPRPVIISTIKPMDCTDVLQQGNKTSGIYEVWPRSRLVISKSIKVYCDMKTDGGGWTVIQRRGGFFLLENFYETWENYKNGFGDLQKEFWLGNENIFHISNQGVYEVRFDLEDFTGDRKYAVYKNFWIDSEKDNYTVHVKGYSGNAGDSMEYDNGNVFCTKDRPNGKISIGEFCAVSRRSGWWFDACNKANINGIPSKDSSFSDTRNLYWKEWQTFKSLAKADMKLRRI